ncbi:2',3'-cyclic-nucleotide 2'-phosphodiesterase/3'-nucleotidase [Gracilibacillus halotolerans]|uniref:2',3'-cyclic-nucleotide 2'-phosphodiesterase/3'-nucleotidase n=1 Tax=Gracilibacillus halotolerans TaxID=74386 RepID=A0A841RLJ7_9BACI|nr:bifunctional UDP-sugar hydrolase/5'-nucleotidase [Gracilibacillus halotolerans]MBB6512045.1 2',3'-cyclic-nucleotide 2'-phosphodiesterase/3'-nucleotidase [Gracilibacillus halotolerans]
MNQKATLKIVYTSDIHGHALPILYGTNEPAELGLIKYASAVRQIREENEFVIVMDNGDLIQGTPLMTHYVKEHVHQPNPMISIMNQMNIDAGIIGNHEFNFGLSILQDAMKQSNYPWLSANILDKETGKPFFGPPYIIKTLSNGIKVGIIGVTTHYIPNWEKPEHIEGIYFADAYRTLKDWVQELREDCDVLLAAYHGGFERDVTTGEVTENLTGENQGYEMASTIDGIDVLLTGHQHRILTGMVNDCLVIQPGNNAQTFGEITIEMVKDDELGWRIENKSADVHSVEGVEADSVLLKDMELLESSTQAWLDKPMGLVEGDMLIRNPHEARLQKHPFIEFIQRVQMDVSGAPISVTSLLNNEAKGFPATIRMRDIVSNYPYPNTLVVLSLTGQDIKLALEKSAAYFSLDGEKNIVVNPEFINPKPQHYNYDMWEGIDYTIRVSNPFGKRVEDITFQGEPLDMDKSYHVVMNNYRASGGGDFDMFKDKPIVKDIRQDMVELICEYIQKHETIKATIHPNFKVVV